MEMEFAARIQALREGLGLTQAKFAEVLIVSQGAVSRWEQGKHAPSEPMLAKIAALAGITSAELRYGASYAPPGGEALSAAPGATAHGTAHGTAVGTVDGTMEGAVDGTMEGAVDRNGRPLAIRSKRIRRRVTDLLEDCVIKARSSGKSDVATALEVILDKCWADAAHYRKHLREKDKNEKQTAS